MSPGAEPLQLLMTSDQSPASISSWSTVNRTASVASSPVQQPLSNSAKFSRLTSSQLLMWILFNSFQKSTSATGGTAVPAGASVARVASNVSDKSVPAR